MSTRIATKVAASRRRPTYFASGQARDAAWLALLFGVLNWRKYLESWVGSEWVGRSHLCVCRVGTPPRRVNNYSIGCHSDRVIEEQTQGKHVTRSVLGRSVGRRPPRAGAPPIMIVEQVLVRLPAAPAAARRPGSRGPARIDPGRRARSLAAPLPASLARRVGGRRHRVQLRGLVHCERRPRSAFFAPPSEFALRGGLELWWVGASARRS